MYKFVPMLFNFLVDVCVCVCVYQSVGVHTQFVSTVNGAPTLSQFICVYWT